ncbi:MAG: MFS transporter [Burkholderiaceae bacterium]
MRLRLEPAHVVIIAGVAAALHVGKLPPALPVLQADLGITLVQAGFLLSLVQLAGMTLGLAVGLAADGIGLKRSMIAGLVVLSVASALGGFAEGPSMLLGLRALEGFGFLLAATPAPSLIRKLVAPQRLDGAMGLWGAYMPFATALALLCGPAAIGVIGWQGWWWLLAVLSLAVAGWLGMAVPGAQGISGAPGAATGAQSNSISAGSSANGWRGRLSETLRAPGPWLVALGFAMYSGQWLAVVGFLPSVYAAAGVTGWTAAILTASAAAVNMAGNIGSGRLLQRGVRPQALLFTGYLAMGFAAVLAFMPWEAWPAAARYCAVLVFSGVGGVIPGTLFSLSVRLAPGPGAVSTTVGFMQQWSALGQFAGPPLVAWVASAVGGWHWTWAVTGVFSAMGLVVAAQVGRLLGRTGSSPR